MDNITGRASAGGKTDSGIDGAVIRVLVASDCPLLREGIRSAIETGRNLALCGLCDNQSETLEAIPHLKPHVIASAFPLKDPATFTLLEEAREGKNRTPLLIVASEDDPDLMERVVRSGAQAVIGRLGSKESLVETIHRLARGLRGMEPKAGEAAEDQVATTASREMDINSHRFTEREQKILDLMGDGLMPREIANALNLSVKTVESHRHNIKQKLGVKTSARLAHYAFQRRHNVSLINRGE